MSRPQVSAFRRGIKEIWHRYDAPTNRVEELLVVGISPHHLLVETPRGFERIVKRKDCRKDRAQAFVDGGKYLTEAISDLEWQITKLQNKQATLHAAEQEMLQAEEKAHTGGDIDAILGADTSRGAQ